MWHLPSFKDITPKIPVKACMLVDGCLQPILMILKICMSPPSNGSLVNYAVLPWKLKRTNNCAIKCSETNSSVNRAEDCYVRGSGFESLAKHFYINDSCIVSRLILNIPQAILRKESIFWYIVGFILLFFFNFFRVFFFFFFRSRFIFFSLTCLFWLFFFFISCVH